MRERILVQYLTKKSIKLILELLNFCIIIRVIISVI